MHQLLLQRTGTVQTERDGRETRSRKWKRMKLGKPKEKGFHCLYLYFLLPFLLFYLGDQQNGHKPAATLEGSESS